ncbi:inorganic phosphate transporter [Lysinibacter sp. HNR]|uniref:inorganic phosphate transporter n=1 Tax=Lysinibacter sp. HNR TaxID=3031408 RepID=UPI002434DB57|nr:inorganic phosphate transporter [Lysinibacter sp. HNR]WGD37680.1 inorganic phosphate transporter [Lysinibacter sp. HNR]
MGSDVFFIVNLVAAAFFIGLVGRNDGAPLVALAQQTSRGSGLWAPVLVVAALPILPLLGVRGVAESLEALMFGVYFSDQARFSLLLAVVITIALSAVLAVPNSITLALVGALVGVSLANDASINGEIVLRVLLLAAIAPILAMLLAWMLGSLPLRLAPGRAPRVLSILRKIAFAALALVYSANDGQKVLFIATFTTGISLAAAAKNPVLIAVSTTFFLIGVLAGLRRSGQALRQGSVSPGPIQALWAQLSAVTVLSIGTALGAPLSMTQSIVGAVVGSGLTRGWRSIRWMPVARIAAAWLWSLPISAFTAWFLTSLLTVFSRG